MTEHADSPASDGWPDTVAEHHRQQLIASGITPEHAVRRGYETIKDPRRLAHIRIAKAGQRTMGLLIPLRTFDGSAWGYQYRPDHPREYRGKPLKYETPTGQSNRLDIPPGVGRLLGDPSVPLWITEGAKKADCAVVYGLCCVALLGVWSWRHTNAAGGKVAIPDFANIALNGREVVIAYDSDVVRKESANKAMVALAGYLASKGAQVRYLWLPDNGDGKTGLDDYLVDHSVEEMWGLVRPDPPPLNNDHSSPPDSTATPQQSWSGVVPGVAGLRRILDAVAKEVQARGLVGEERLAQTLFLIFTSRLLDKQVSAGVKGHSASGKSYTVEAVTEFFPPESYIEFTGMSQRALIYSTEEYAHRTLVVYEVTALREGVEDDMTSYFLRSLLSEGRIEYEVTIRDPNGGFTTRRITKEGPTNFVFTTTKTRVHAENETRILSLATDDSRDQTQRVLLELANEGNGSGDMQEWHELQRWLASEHAEHRVTIPYAPQLAQLVPPLAVRLRRDFGSVLALIRAHAVLHQASRERDDTGRIIATLDDYTVVRELVADIVAENVGATVADTVRQTVRVVEEVTASAGPIADHLQGASLLAVAQALKLDKSNASRRLRVAAEGGYVRNLEDKRGKPGRWVVGDPLPEAVVVLPDPAQLATPDTIVDLECCAVAAESGGENGDTPQSTTVEPDDRQSETEAVRLVTDILGARVISTAPGTDARNGAYLGGLCVDCHTELHSPGRPRCEACHTLHLRAMAGGDPA
jgi:hypothetical protein